MAVSTTPVLMASTLVMMAPGGSGKLAGNCAGRCSAVRTPAQAGIAAAGAATTDPRPTAAVTRALVQARSASMKSAVSASSAGRLVVLIVPVLLDPHRQNGGETGFDPGLPPV